MTEIQNSKLDEPVKSPLCTIFVIPAKAGIQLFQGIIDSRFRRSDGNSDFLRYHQTYDLKEKPLFRLLDIGIWDLFVIWCLVLVFFDTKFQGRAGEL